MSVEKLIFAKATAENFCAIVVYAENKELIVCDVVELPYSVRQFANIVVPDDIRQFINNVAASAKKHTPELVQYECSVYLSECRDLRELLSKDDIKVRGYKSEGNYLDRIISQANWIAENVVINEEFSQFTQQILSFKPSDKDKSNIALDVLSDAAKFMRRQYFE